MMFTDVAMYYTIMRWSQTIQMNVYTQLADDITRSMALSSHLVIKMDIKIMNLDKWTTNDISGRCLNSITTSTVTIAIYMIATPQFNCANK